MTDAFPNPSAADQALCNDAFARECDRLAKLFGHAAQPANFANGFHAALEIERTRGAELRFKAHSAFCAAVDAAAMEADRAGVDAAAICGLLAMKIRMIQDEAVEAAKE